MLKFKRAYTGGPLFGGDGAEAIALGIALLAQVKKRPQTPKPPTPAQIAAGERSDWNAEVARRKAENNRRRSIEHGTD